MRSKKNRKAKQMIESKVKMTSEQNKLVQRSK